MPRIFLFFFLVFAQRTHQSRLGPQVHVSRSDSIDSYVNAKFLVNAFSREYSRAAEAINTRLSGSARSMFAILHNAIYTNPQLPLNWIYVEHVASCRCQFLRTKRPHMIGQRDKHHSNDSNRRTTTQLFLGAKKQSFSLCFLVPHGWTGQHSFRCFIFIKFGNENNASHTLEQTFYALAPQTRGALRVTTESDYLLWEKRELRISTPTSKEPATTSLSVVGIKFLENIRHSPTETQNMKPFEKALIEPVHISYYSIFIVSFCCCRNRWNVLTHFSLEISISYHYYYYIAVATKIDASQRWHAISRYAQDNSQLWTDDERMATITSIYILFFFRFRMPSGAQSIWTKSKNGWLHKKKCVHRFHKFVRS